MREEKPVDRQPRSGEETGKTSRSRRGMPAGAAEARLRGLFWLLLLAGLGWALSSLDQLRSTPLRLLSTRVVADASVEFFGDGGSKIDLVLVRGGAASLDAKRMVLSVPVLDRDVIVPRGARTVLVGAAGEVLVLDRALPGAVVRAVLSVDAPSPRSLIEELSADPAARTALESLPDVQDFLARILTRRSVRVDPR